MRILACAALLLAFAAPIAAQRIDGVPYAAEVVEMAPATLDELAHAVVMAPIGEHEERPRPMRAASRAAGHAIVAELVPVGDAIAAPPVTRGFSASFSPLISGGAGYNPADASGAAGPRHVVGVFNNSLSIHDRNGTQLSLVSIYQFWHDPTFADTFLFDPRVIYDAGNDRWVMALLSDVNLRQGNLFLAISATGDPTAAWRRFRIPISADPNVDGDFTRMAATADQIVITLNEWIGDVDYGTDVYTIPKAAAYTATVTPTATKTKQVFDVGPVSSSDTTVRLVELLPQGVILYTPGSNGTLYTSPVPIQLGAGDCSQLGTTSKVQCDSLPFQYGLMHDGVLWIVHGANGGSRDDVIVWKISGGTARVFVLHDDAFDSAFPSIAVNRYGAALVGYSILDASIYPSAGYRYIDPAGNVSAPVTVKSGENWTTFRWADYSSTVVDPADDTSFWTLQSYTPPGPGSHNAWATWWSYVQVKPPQRVRAVKH